MSALARAESDSGVLSLLLEVLVDPMGVFRWVVQRGARIEYSVVPLLIFIAVATLELVVRLGDSEAGIAASVPVLFAADPEGFRAFRYFSGVFHLTLGCSVFFFGTSFVLWWVANLFGDQRVDFRSVLGIVGLSLGVPILGGIATLLLVQATGDARAAFSVWYLLWDGQAQGFWAFLASSIHFFHLWYVYVLGLGLARLTRFGVGSCIGICMVLWILPKLLVF